MLGAKQLAFARDAAPLARCSPSSANAYNLQGQVVDQMPQLPVAIYQNSFIIDRWQRRIDHGQ
jgi:hypothetical protein